MFRAIVLIMAISASLSPPTYRPHKGQQTRFHLSDDIFEVLYGGEAGGGKTAALTAESLRQVKNPNYQGILFRRTNDELEQIKIEARRMFPAAGGIYRENDNTGIFPSGARIYLRYMQYEQDCLKYQGREFQFIGFDELTHFNEHQYTYLFSRCRTTDPDLVCIVRSSANPGGPGHPWVKKRFIDAVPAGPGRKPQPKYFWKGADQPGAEWVEREVPRGTANSYNRAFVPASRFDNPTLMKADPGYEGRIRGMHDPLLAEAILTGNWDLFAGQFFTRFRKQIHVIPEFDIPDWWTRIRGLDRGFAAPFCCEWMAVDGDGSVYFYDEIHETEKSPQWLCEQIHRHTGSDRIDYTYGGRDFWVRNPMAWNREDTPEYVAEHEAAAFAAGGITIIAANQDRKQGWALMHRMMDWEGDIATKLTKTPQFYLIRGKCPNLESQIVAAVRDPHDVEDIPDGGDDALEAARYAAMHLQKGVRPAEPVPDLRQEIEDLMREDSQGGTYEWSG